MEIKLEIVLVLSFVPLLVELFGLRKLLSIFVLRFVKRELGEMSMVDLIAKQYLQTALKVSMLITVPIFACPSVLKIKIILVTQVQGFVWIDAQLWRVM